MKLKILSVCLLGIFAASQPLQATTYVIQENGVEVGRWEEPDGSDRVEVIDSEKKAPSRSEGADEPAAAGPVWKVSGRLVDLLNLQAVRAEKITFQDGQKRYDFPVKGGAFAAELPKLEGGYSMIVEAEGYNPAKLFVLAGESFSKKDYLLRLQAWTEVPPRATIRGPVYNLEIGLCRLALSAKEQKELEAVMRVAGG